MVPAVEVELDGGTGEDRRMETLKNPSKRTSDAVMVQSHKVRAEESDWFGSDAPWGLTPLICQSNSQDYSVNNIQTLLRKTTNMKGVEVFETAVKETGL